MLCCRVRWKPQTWVPWTHTTCALALQSSPASSDYAPVLLLTGSATRHRWQSDLCLSQASGRRSSRVSARVVREQEESKLAEMQVQWREPARVRVIVCVVLEES